MYVIDYQYRVPTIDCGDHLEIEGINRDDYTTAQYVEGADKIVLTKPTAVLFAGGVGIHQSESRDVTSVNKRYVGSVPYGKSKMLVKEISAYSLHKWIGEMENNELVRYASINHNTCASSMHSVYEAQRLLDSGEVDEVIVITEERTSFNTIRIFKEHNIPLTVSDGFAIVRFGREGDVEVTDTKWKYEWDRNPFGTSVEGYKLVTSECDVVKPHGTGTDNNNEAEVELVAGKKTVYYKPKYGHMQGASSLVEMCLVMDDDDVHGDVLCVAAGLGGFYGSCVIRK